MIFIGTQKIDFAKALKRELVELGAKVEVASPKDRGFLNVLYDPSVTAVVADEQFVGIPPGVSVDILNSVGKRVPVVVLSSNVRVSSARNFNEHVTILQATRKEDVLTALGILGFIDKSNFKSYCSSVPYFNIQIPIGLLKEHKGLGILTVDASSFSKIGLEYGIDVYSRLKDVFQSILFELWGKPGSFRDSDILCRKSVASNIYYIFLDRSRETGSLPYPGALERVADRLMANIQNALWDELFSRNSRIHDCISSIPSPCVGFVGVLENPCIEAAEIIEAGLEDSRRVAISQIKRLKERQLEFMQTLIQSSEFLKPNFQGIFKLSDISEDQIKEAHAQKSLMPLEDALFGFESLKWPIA